MLAYSAPVAGAFLRATGDGPLAGLHFPLNGPHPPFFPFVAHEEGGRNLPAAVPGGGDAARLHSNTVFLMALRRLVQMVWIA